MCRTIGFFDRLGRVWPFAVGESMAGTGGAGDVERGVVEGTGVLGGIGVLVGSAMALMWWFVVR